LQPLFRISSPATLEATGENKWREPFYETTVINVMNIKLAQLLLLLGMVAGLTMVSPSMATTAPHGTKSSMAEAVKGTINQLIQTLDEEPLNQREQS